jgi:thiopeptide-type bacteriocin biosynthesis protein
MSLPDIERGVLDVLAGQSLPLAAEQRGLPAAELAEAVECYRTAGRAALEPHIGAGWQQVNLEFADWNSVEQEPAALLRVELERAQAAGAISSWWFIRKAPCWRLRIHPGKRTTRQAAMQHIERPVRNLKASGHITRSWMSIYEPETAAFGGHQGMQIAHNLFHADSHAILNYLTARISSTEHPVGRRELSIVLCSALMRGAGQDWFEQGDIWSQVADLRPVPSGTSLERLPELAANLRHLMTIDTRPTSALITSSTQLTFVSAWIEAFSRTGAALAVTRLSRGMRETIAHHIIFHWNRMGLSATTQSILTRAAKEAVFLPPAARR